MQILSDIVLETKSGSTPKFDTLTILETLWHAAHGHFPSKNLFNKIDLVPPLDKPLTKTIIEAAKNAFQDIVEESQINEDVFEMLLMFQFKAMLSVTSFEDNIPDEERKTSIEFMRSVVFALFAEPAIKITNRLINFLENLVNEKHREEEYQKFLTKHPVFIDPLASEVIPKQKLGIEHITDFVIRRLDNEYILVEIEKPQDAIFTGGNDFTSKFTHAYGQILDFQEWVDVHSEYARSLMPGIVSPKGVLIIGMRKDLPQVQIEKLKRFSINSRSIEIFTFDDLINKSKDLYRNIYKKRN